jgi:hypothetical protein
VCSAASERERERDTEKRIYNIFDNDRKILPSYSSTCGIRIKLNSEFALSDGN